MIAVKLCLITIAIVARYVVTVREPPNNLSFRLNGIQVIVSFKD